MALKKLQMALRHWLSALHAQHGTVWRHLSSRHLNIRPIGLFDQRIAGDMSMAHVPGVLHVTDRLTKPFSACCLHARQSSTRKTGDSSANKLCWPPEGTSWRRLSADCLESNVLHMSVMVGMLEGIAARCAHCDVTLPA